MKRTWIYDKQGQPHELIRELSQHHFIQPDIEEHGGRAAWRERLKRNDSIEVSPKDLAQQQEKWNSRKSDFAAKVKLAEKLNVRPSDAPVMESRPYEMSRLNKELANRLDGRPAPDRKMLLKMTLDLAREYRR